MPEPATAFASTASTTSRSRLTWWSAAAVYAALTLIYTWPLVRSIASVLPSDTGDPGLVAWVLWWNAHAVPFTARWWNAPMFFPLPGVLALSETFLGLAPFSTPLQWATGSAVVAHNLLFILSFPACALAAHALAKHLTGRHDAAFVAGLAFGFSPYRASQFPHLHLLAAWWMPIALLALHRFIESRHKRYLLIFGVSWLLNGLTTGYYLVSFAVLVAFWIVWFVRKPREFVAIGAAIVVASLPFVPILSAYHRYQAALDLTRDSMEIQKFSADLSAFWAASPYLSLAPHWTVAPRVEGEIYPGVVILVLIAIAALSGWRRIPDRSNRLRFIPAAAGAVVSLLPIVALWTGRRHLTVAGATISILHPGRPLALAAILFGVAVFWTRRWLVLWRQRRSPLVFYSAAAVAMMVLAMGPVGRVFGTVVIPHMPYEWLMNLPGGHALRVPARFGMLVALALAVCASAAFARLVRPGRATLFTAAVLVGVGLDGWVGRLPVAVVPSPIVLGGIDAQTPVFEIPMVNLYSDTAAMLRATTHQHPIVNGFSGYEPPHYEVLFEAIHAGDPDVFRGLQYFGPIAVLVNRADDRSNHYSQFLANDVPGAKFVYQTPLGALFSLPSRTPPARSAGEPPLIVNSIEASADQWEARHAIDGNISTVWQTPRPQLVGDQLILHFEKPVTVTRLEMDIGAPVLNYPRQVRIDADAPGKPVTTVWSGRLAGAALYGALVDRARTPIIIELPPSACTRLTLTLTESHPTSPWTVADIEAFGSIR